MHELPQRQRTLSKTTHGGTSMHEEKEKPWAQRRIHGLMCLG